MSFEKRIASVDSRLEKIAQAKPTEASPVTLYEGKYMYLGEWLTLFNDLDISEELRTKFQDIWFKWADKYRSHYGDIGNAGEICEARALKAIPKSIKEVLFDGEDLSKLALETLSVARIPHKVKKAYNSFL